MRRRKRLFRLTKDGPASFGASFWAMMNLGEPWLAALTNVHWMSCQPELRSPALPARSGLPPKNRGRANTDCDIARSPRRIASQLLTRNVIYQLAPARPQLSWCQRHVHALCHCGQRLLPFPTIAAMKQWPAGRVPVCRFASVPIAISASVHLLPAAPLLSRQHLTTTLPYQCCHPTPVACLLAFTDAVDLPTAQHTVEELAAREKRTLPCCLCLFSGKNPGTAWHIYHQEHEK